jgi:Tfp pilus assembly protein PilV
MNKLTNQEMLIGSVIAIGVLGALAYYHRDTLFVSEGERQSQGALLTKIVMRLQPASYRAKKNLTPMTRRDIENIIWLEVQQYNKENKSSVKVTAVFSDNSNVAAVKHITLQTRSVKTTAKIYCR